MIITDLGILRYDTDAAQFVLTEVHRGVEVDDVIAATGWDLRVASSVRETPAPQPIELDALRSFVKV